MSQTASFILASSSPRRKELLQREGYRFEVIASGVDEETLISKGMSCVEAARRLALAKALDVAALYPDRLVMGADTLVDLNGNLIGKPADAAEAALIVRQLFVSPHKVITGLALVWKERGIQIAKTDTTIVYPRKMTEAQIAKHIDGGTWQGKAGAYAIQETADQFVERIEGSFTNVIGLPMELVKSLLEKIGISLRT